MGILTIISDWNKDDYYVAAVKGAILSRCPDAMIVDISHRIQAFNIAEASHVLQQAYPCFPPGTVHMVAVKSEADQDHPHVALRYRDHFFIGNDNGIFGLLLENEPQECITLPPKDPVSFPELAVYAPAACHILEKGNLAGLGESHDRLYRQVPMLPAIDQHVINGSVIYIDSYHNAITNIHRSLFDQIGKGRPYEIFVQSNYFRITSISRRYQETTPGEILALFNASGLLEIAINGGNASELLNLGISSSVRIKFRETDAEQK